MLVIIGLIVGGVLVGQDMISAAEVRATISQIEKYNTAVNAFYGKYGYLPGDMPASYASQFGFTPRGYYEGQGDGNGVIEGSYGNNNSSSWGAFEGDGETLMFWMDLSAAKMIDGSFTSAAYCCGLNFTLTTIGFYLPAARMGHGNYIYVWSIYQNWANYLGFSAVTGTNGGQIVSSPSLTVQQAYNIDMKYDDGLPQSGKITAQYLNYDGSNGFAWAGSTGGDNGGGTWTTATPGSLTSCFDNGSGTGPQKYSMEQNRGNGPNCALSFQMQGAGR